MPVQTKTTSGHPPAQFTHAHGRVDGLRAFHGNGRGSKSGTRGLLQIGSAGYAFYNTSRDYNRLANNYTHLCIEYQKSILAYSMADNDEERLAVLHATGQEAVREACVWAYESGNNEPTPPIS